jgi:hypothetical protein
MTVIRARDRGVKPTERVRKLAAEALQARAAAKAADIESIITELRAAGITSRSGIAAALSGKGIPTARGAGVWTATQVSRVLARLLIPPGG